MKKVYTHENRLLVGNARGLLEAQGERDGVEALKAAAKRLEPLAERLTPDPD